MGLTAEAATPSEGPRSFGPPALAPESGQLAFVRGRMWVVADVARATQPAAEGQTPQHLVTLISVEDDATGEELTVVWEIEPGTRVVEQAELPPIRGGLDDPAELDAFLDAVRWGAVTSADQRAVQAPFRSGITIEDYQLEPLVRALQMPRATLLVADDVGLGKTIEAGLVVQELLLRHRARTVLVVCPAALQVQWRDELREKFGLEFRIVDRQLLGALRRARGVGANPFAHFPRLIVSIDWLKGPLGMRLLREVLPAHPEIPRRYDVLIVDEVHNCAPSGAGGRYARDTQRTAAIRTLAPHCEHRLFLSATPHNGYDNSFAALLELLDPHRFARGIRPRPEATDEVTVRRLKSELTDNEGRPRFPRRTVVMLEVEHPPDERAVHADLAAYAVARRRRLRGDRAAELAADFVVTLLKKRLFSSPAAFLRTLEVHRETLARRPSQAPPPTPTVLRRLFDDAAQDLDDEQAEEGVGAATQEALMAAEQSADGGPTDEEHALLDRMLAWARQAAVREDARTARLLDWVEQQVKPRGRFGDERVIVFTEFRATQRYLQERLAARGIHGERVALLDGTTDDEARERIKAQWQEPPEAYPVRVLLATDAASEGISLQRHCHLLAHAEIPWNPNRLEQRNGRVDRHGQTAPEVLVHHIASTNWKAPERQVDGSLEGDLDFLARVVRKVEQIRDDLGSAGPVIASQIEEAMLGRRRALDERRFGDNRELRRLLRQRLSMRERLVRLRAELEQSRETLHLQPDRVERVVRTALRLARQPPLEPGEEPGTWIVPAFTADGWSQATRGLAHPARADEQRPITFDHELARERTDVVLAHLGHRLVRQSLALLRAEVWGMNDHLRRVTVRYADASLDVPAAIAFGRLVVTGATGHRLHEQVVAAGLRLPGDGATERLKVGETDAAIELALDAAVPDTLSDRLLPRLREAADRLRAALEARAADRARDLATTLVRRSDEEQRHVAETLLELEATIRREAFGEGAAQLQLVTGLELDAGDRRQVEADRRALQERLDRIPDEIVTEQAAIARRYAEPRHRLFPVAVMLLVPEGVQL
jgi:superfamily II DNA or RNA helicase